ncbi:hypothetical protein BDR03DRAFT_705392 [Suillus americanus]|nr:hypothetical protein BDR03DRAFT_705392 [Suillus americanus]
MEYQVLLVEIEDAPVRVSLPKSVITKIHDPRFNYKPRTLIPKTMSHPLIRCQQKATASCCALPPGDD